MAEGCRHRVVVGATPFAEEVRPAENRDSGACRVGEPPQTLFGVTLAHAIGVVQFSLGRGGECDLGRPAARHEMVAYLLREPGVSRFVFRGRRRTVHARQMENHVRAPQGVPKLLFGEPKIELAQFNVARRRRTSTRFLPTNPRAPVTTTLMRASPSIPLECTSGREAFRPFRQGRADGCCASGSPPSARPPLRLGRRTPRS